MTKVPEQPALAPSVQLVGEMQGSGFKDRQWLIQRDGHYIQVTELLYRVAEQANGERTLREIAAELTERTDWVVTEDHVRLLLRKLIPLELIATAHGSVNLHAKASSSHRTGSLLSLNITHTNNQPTYHHSICKGIPDPLRAASPHSPPACHSYHPWLVVPSICQQPKQQLSQFLLFLSGVTACRDSDYDRVRLLSRAWSCLSGSVWGRPSP